MGEWLPGLQECFLRSPESFRFDSNISPQSLWQDRPISRAKVLFLGKCWHLLVRLACVVFHLVVSPQRAGLLASYWHMDYGHSRVFHEESASAAIHKKRFGSISQWTAGTGVNERARKRMKVRIGNEMWNLVKRKKSWEERSEERKEKNTIWVNVFLFS